MTTKSRVLLAIILSLLLIAIYAFIGVLGFWMGVMGTDSCRGVEDYAIAYLVLGWPAILLLAALAPGFLLLLKVRGWNIGLGGALAFVFAMLSYLIYPLLLQSACRPIGSP
ncbi:MAG TPA: hypothetical protein VFW62_13335 [bacterium]|nr:hypothetical protein [bacterium]